MDDFQNTFQTLKSILEPYSPKFNVVTDKPGHYYLFEELAKFTKALHASKAEKFV